MLEPWVALFRPAPIHNFRCAMLSEWPELYIYIQPATGGVEVLFAFSEVFRFGSLRMTSRGVIRLDS